MPFYAGHWWHTMSWTAHIELMMSSTCPVTDSFSVTVTPSTFSDVTRAIPWSSGDGGTRRLFRLSVNTISADLDWFSVRLLTRDHSSILLISRSRLLRRYLWQSCPELFESVRLQARMTTVPLTNFNRVFCIAIVLLLILSHNYQLIIHTGTFVCVRKSWNVSSLPVVYSCFSFTFCSILSCCAVLCLRQHSEPI